MRLLEIYSPQDLAGYAEEFEDNADGGESVGLYNWVFTETLPLALLVTKNDIHGRVHSLQEWIEWFKEAGDEIEADMGHRQWDSMLGEEIEEPIVITMDKDGSAWDMWDGWHRTGASLSSGKQTIPAVVGYPKE
jgi:hypothetical protein